MLSSTSPSQEKQAFLSAITQVNGNAALLPNTTLRVAECSTFIEADHTKTGNKLLRELVKTNAPDRDPVRGVG